MVLIETTCANCQFKEMHTNVQTGCEIGVLERLKEISVPISTHVVSSNVYAKFPRVCMYRRDQNWTGDNDKLISEVFIPSTFIIIHTGDASKLHTTLSSLSCVSTKKPIRIIVCHEDDDLKKIGEISSSYFSSYQCVYMVDKLYDGIMYDEAFRRAKNGWVFFVDSGKDVDPLFLEKVNLNKNVLLDDFVAVSGEVSGYMAVVYKYCRGNRQSSIDDKLKEMNARILSSDEMERNYRAYIERE